MRVVCLLRCNNQGDTESQMYGHTHTAHVPSCTSLSSLQRLRCVFGKYRTPRAACGPLPASWPLCPTHAWANAVFGPGCLAILSRKPMRRPAVVRACNIVLPRRRAGQVHNLVCAPREAEGPPPLRMRTGPIMRQSTPAEPTAACQLAVAGPCTRRLAPPLPMFRVA